MPRRPDWLTPAMSDHHEIALSVRQENAARQGGGKQKYKSRENGKQKNEKPTRHRGGRGRMKDRSNYNRLMKQQERQREKETEQQLKQ